MNKKLLALAIAGTMAAPMAAHAEASIFGYLNLSASQIDNDNAGADEDSGLGFSTNSSNIGLKGSEDLGGGMQAVWQVTTFIDATDTTKAGGQEWANGNSFVGLAGGFGTAIIGRHDTPYKTVGRKVDLFGNSVGDSRTVINQGDDLRTSNTLAYISPDMNGFSAVLAYVADAEGDATDDNDNDAVSGSLNYAAGPLYVGLAYQNVSSPTTAEDPENMRLAAAYTMGALKFTGLFQTDTDVNDNERDTWGLGAAFNMGGGNTLKAQYYLADESDDGDENGWNKWAIGFDHAMSKQTTLYAHYAAVGNDDAASVNVTASSGHGDAGPAGATDAGGDPSAFSLGVVHKF